MFGCYKIEKDWGTCSRKIIADVYGYQYKQLTEYVSSQTADQQYQDAFNDELESFKERVRGRAKIRIEKAMKEYEEEERQKRLGPGGLDPVEVYESLPVVSSQEAFAHSSFIFSPNWNHLQSVFWITGDAEMLWWEGYSDVTRRDKQNGPNGRFSYLNISIFLLNHWPCCLCSVSYQKI